MITLPHSTGKVKLGHSSYYKNRKVLNSVFKIELVGYNHRRRHPSCRRFCMRYVWKRVTLICRWTASRGHPHSTYAVHTKEEGRGQAKCVRLPTGGEGGVQGCVRTQKKFFGSQNLKTFLFLYKRSYYIAVYCCVYKSVNRS